MRLIDCDALKKDWSMADHCEDCPQKVIACQYDQVFTRMDVCQMLDDAPTVSGWVSVKDRLPKSMGNKVLVWLEHEDYVGYIGYGHYEKHKGGEAWYDLEHNEQFAKRGYSVTHWMPLPEAPHDVP